MRLTITLVCLAGLSGIGGITFALSAGERITSFCIPRFFTPGAREEPVLRFVPCRISGSGILQSTSM